MTPKGLLDTTIGMVDGVAPDDGDILARRARLLHWTQHLYNYIHQAHEWEWTFAETPFTVDAGKDYAFFVDTETAPAVIETGIIPDFLEFGRNGSLYRGNTPMLERPKYRVQRIRRQIGGVGSGYDSRIFGIWSGALQFAASHSSNTDYVAFHRIRPEVLLDDETEMLMPDKYKDTVMLPAMAWRVMEGKQDQRETWANQFNEGYSQMMALENPEKTQRKRVPLSLHGVW